MLKTVPSLATTPIETIIFYLSNPELSSQPTILCDDDWDDVAITAIALGLAPLLHWHLEQAGISIPPMAMAKLGVTRQAHAKRNKAIAWQLDEVLSACAQQEVDVLVLKGALLAATVYPDPALRPMNDIDLLFRTQDLAKIGPIFAGLGYQGKHKEADVGPGITKHLSTYRRQGNEGATPNPYVSAGGDRMIEPHGSLEESWFGLKVDITPGVWERAVSISLSEQSAYRLSTSDMILHLAVHATFHVIMGASVFVQLYDIGQALCSWADVLDWDQIVSLTAQAQAEPFVYAALYWAYALFGAPVPEARLSGLKQQCVPELVAYIHALDGLAIFERSQQPPLTTVGQRLRRGIEDRRETARWATSTADKWKVWQTALAFHKTDTMGLFQKRLARQE